MASSEAQLKKFDDILAEAKKLATQAAIDRCMATQVRRNGEVAKNEPLDEGKKL